MKLLIIVLNKEEYLEKLLSLLVELEISGATMLDSESVGRFLAYQVPIFAGLQEIFGQSRVTSKTILAVVKDKDFMDNFKQLIKKEGIDFTQPDTGIIITVPVKDVITSE
ncbi:MAG: hypothetical protein K9L69_02435 [Candidatus Omnitrophica bacterium]|nr:hypothetical protein [Candidatus Omnitrophota bacterium]MCF7887638.1 hypothetical protein [Candidatus Omnitrophota bacterium]MCF7894977.1 hypothetical protein [Candidatus Omnitrophota bacterium]